MGLFFGWTGVHDFLTRKVALGVTHIVLMVFGIFSIPTLFIMEFFDAFRCGTGTMCPSGTNWGILWLAFVVAPPVISCVMGLIESIILFATASKYPSQYTAMKQEALLDKNENL